MLPILDREDALDRVGGDRNILRMILEAFEVQAPEDIAEMKAALAQREAYRLEVAAHRMKGAVSTLGGKECTALAFVIEQRARALAKGLPDATWDGLDLELQRFLEGLARLQPELDRLAAG